MAQHLPSPFRQPQRYATHPAVPKLISRRFIRAQALLLLSAAIASGASPIAHETSSDGLVLDLKLPPYEVETTLGANASFHEILPPAGFGRLADSGRPALPFVAAPIAVPEGASIDVEVLDSHVVELADVHLRPLQAPDAGEGASAPDYSSGFYPGEVIQVEEMGILRGVRAVSVRLYPFHYDAPARQLKVYEWLRIAVRFRGGSTAKAAAGRLEESPEAALYASFLNASSAAALAALQPTAANKPLVTKEGWYDPSAPWLKVDIVADGLFRIDAEWLRQREVDVESIDPRTFRLLGRGDEQPLFVDGEADGRFDEIDFLLFYGRYRRAESEPGVEKDHDSIYGNRNTYWLTWGGRSGLRFAEKSAAPVNGYPESEWYWTTAHFERDVWYQQFPDAPDNDRDHWFWKRDPITGRAVDSPGSATFPDDLASPYLEEDYTAGLRVALHGLTPGHHTVLKLNDREVEEREWVGQDEIVFSNEIPSSYLIEGTNRVLVQAFANDSTGADLSYFNWFEIDYRRRYDSWNGFLAWTELASEGGRRIAVSNLIHPDAWLFDLDNHLRLTGLQIDSLMVDDDEFPIRYVATFEDESDGPSNYVIADSANIHTPTGALDVPSTLRTSSRRADYLIISHPRFVGAAHRLAEHRRTYSGLQVETVTTEDIYDEFSDGLIEREAIADFIDYAYHSWERRPVYVLLMGDATYDYRNIIGGGNPSFVPTLYYHARQRGNSPSDFLYTLVDGDDLLPDLSIGRLAVESDLEAEQVVDKIIRYDTSPAPGDWRSRVIYLANFHEKGLFAASNDDLATRFTEPFGLSSTKIYSPDESPVPNQTGKRFLDALNHGALFVNFAGHGSAGNMQFIFALQFPDWDYLGHVRNEGRLPFVLALSCLNGMFVNPIVDGLGEVFTVKADGGSIAYVSASAKSFVAQNELLSGHFYDQLFVSGNLSFGPTLNTSKVLVLAEHPSFVTSARTMQLFGDPAQKLALPGSPDYEPVTLQTPAQVLGQSTIGLAAIVRNNGRITSDSVSVVLIGRASDGGTDTLLSETRPSFAGTDTISFDWSVDDRRGAYALDLMLDPDDRISELDEANNLAILSLEILEPVVAEPIFPPPHSALSASELSLEAVVPFDRGESQPRGGCEFELSSAADFASQVTVNSTVSAVDGRCVFVPAQLPTVDALVEQDGEVYFWRSRSVDGLTTGLWSESRSFRIEEAGAISEDIMKWKQAGSQFGTGALEHLVLDEAGRLRLTSATLPMRPSGQTREDGFTVRDLEGAGVLCTDGTYLYAKRWYNDASTIYPGTDFFARIGTGFNGTRRDLLYDTLADSTTAGISATYHSDGYIYNESGKAYELERISPQTGVLDTVEVPDGLLEWKYGRVEDGHSLITSDGRLIYNVSMSSSAGTRNGWDVRVFDPADSWRLLRSFSSPPTETGFTFEWTDGVVADGERLYFIEFKGERRIRMVDAANGAFLDEWRSDQDTTRIVSGQYDWINNKLWLGDLLGSAIFRYSGITHLDSGRVTSEAIGPARSWHSMEIEMAAGVEEIHVNVQTEGHDGVWTPLEGFSEVTPNQRVDLSAIDAARYPRIRLSAQLRVRGGSRRDDARGVGEGDVGDEGVTLDSWEVEFEARPSVEIAVARADVDSSLRPATGALVVEVSVRNRSAVRAEDTRLHIERLDRRGGFESIRERALGSLERGETRLVVVDSLSLPSIGERLFASATASPLDDLALAARIEIPLPIAAGKLIEFSVWPDGHRLIDGDPLRPDQAILVSVPPVEESRLAIAVDGLPLASDSLLAAAADTGLRALLRPALSTGRHRLQVRLFSGLDEVGSASIDLTVTADLAIANALVYPHPVVDETAFTYVLSHDAEVTVEIFSVSGRLIRRLGPAPQLAGFRQTRWDGRDESGRPLANGTYLYRIAARNGDRAAERRRPLSVLR